MLIKTTHAQVTVQSQEGHIQYRTRANGVLNDTFAQMEHEEVTQKSINWIYNQVMQQDNQNVWTLQVQFLCRNKKFFISYF